MRTVADEDAIAAHGVGGMLHQFAYMLFDSNKEDAWRGTVRGNQQIQRELGRLLADFRCRIGQIALHHPVDKLVGRANETVMIVDGVIPIARAQHLAIHAVQPAGIAQQHGPDILAVD